MADRGSYTDLRRELQSPAAVIDDSQPILADSVYENYGFVSREHEVVMWFMHRSKSTV